MATNQNDPATVFVVDDDPSIQRSLSRLLRLAGYEVKTFSSAPEFLVHKPPASPACVIIDMRMPGMSGLEAQKALEERQSILPIIFLTGHADVPSTVRAIKAGAVDFLTKPFANEQILETVAKAIATHRQVLAETETLAELQARYRSLTPREREVCLLVGRGLLNKQIAGDLGSAERTVKVHRARVMIKMRANSVAELVDILREIGVK